MAVWGPEGVLRSLGRSRLVGEALRIKARAKTSSATPKCYRRYIVALFKFYSHLSVWKMDDTTDPLKGSSTDDWLEITNRKCHCS